MDAGSFTGRQPATGEARGLFLLRVMKEQGYHAVNVGAEEIGLGPELLRSFAAEGTYPFVSANLEDAAGGERLFPEMRIVEAAGVRVGITGVSRPPADAADSLIALGFRFTDPAGALERTLQRLEREVDVIVVLANVPEDEARSLGERFARRVHFFALGQDARSQGDRHGPEHGGAVYLSAMDKGQALGVGRIGLEGGKVSAISGDELILGRRMEPEPAMQTLVDEFEKNLNELAREASTSSVLERGQGDGHYYVGVSECRGCHLREYEIWSETPARHRVQDPAGRGTRGAPGVLLLPRHRKRAAVRVSAASRGPGPGERPVRGVP